MLAIKVLISLSFITDLFGFYWLTFIMIFEVIYMLTFIKRILDMMSLNIASVARKSLTLAKDLHSGCNQVLDLDPIPISFY